MNKMKANIPPLSQQDVLALKGKPMAKIVNNGLSARTGVNPVVEEWVYVGAGGVRECFLFQKGQLVGWTNE